MSKATRSAVAEERKQSNPDVLSEITRQLGEIKTMIEDTKTEMRANLDQTKRELRLDMDSFSQKLQKQLTDLKQDMSQELGAMREMHKKAEDEMKDLKQTVQEEQTYRRHHEMVLNRLENQELMLDYKISADLLRMKGIPEEENEDIASAIITAMAGMLKLEDTEISGAVDLVYRVNSRWAKQRRQPRDVMVKFTSRRLRGEVLKAHYNTPLMMGGKQVIILKEIPFQILKKRAEYKVLTDFLKQKDIRFRWLLPEGLTFSFNERKITINNKEKMDEFLEGKINY